MWKMLLGNVDFKTTSFPFLLYFLALYSVLQKTWPSSPGCFAASSRNIKVSSSSSRTYTSGHLTVCLLKILFYHWSLNCYKDQTLADFEEVQQLLLHLRPKFFIITDHTSIIFRGSASKTSNFCISCFNRDCLTLNVADSVWSDWFRNWKVNAPWNRRWCNRLGTTNLLCIASNIFWVA